MNIVNDKNSNKNSNRPNNRAERRARTASTPGRAALRSQCRQPADATDVIYMTVFIMGFPHVVPFNAGASPFASVVSDTEYAREGWRQLVALRQIHRAALARPEITSGPNLMDGRSPRPLYWMLDPVADTKGIPRVLQSFVGDAFDAHSIHLILTEDTPEQREELAAMLKIGAVQAPDQFVDWLRAEAVQAVSEIMRRLPNVVTVCDPTDALQMAYTTLRATSFARAALASHGNDLTSAMEVIRRLVIRRITGEGAGQ